MPLPTEEVALLRKEEIINLEYLQKILLVLLYIVVWLARNKNNNTIS